MKRVMKNKENAVRVKKEPNDTRPDTGDDNYFGSVDSCEAKNFESFTFYKSSANRINEVMSFHEKLYENVSMDFECKDVKPKLKPPSTTTCKADYQSRLPIVKIENQIQAKYLIDKELIILIKRGFDYDNNRRFKKKFRLKHEKPEKVKIVVKKTQSKLYRKNKLRQKSRKVEAMLNKHINSIHKVIKSFECDICHKSFSFKNNLQIHINVVHNRNKPYKCEICNKSFGYYTHFRYHTMSIHDRNKPFECDVCHKSFVLKNNLKIHIDAVHNRSKPFECDTCQRSFGYKHSLNYHKSHVHGRSKPFERVICPKSLDYRTVLKRHIITVRDRIKGGA